MKVPKGIKKSHAVSKNKKTRLVWVPAIEQIETYKLKRRKGTGNFSLPVPFLVQFQPWVELCEQKSIFLLLQVDLFCVIIYSQDSYLKKSWRMELC